VLPAVEPVLPAAEPVPLVLGSLLVEVAPVLLWSEAPLVEEVELVLLWSEAPVVEAAPLPLASVPLVVEAEEPVEPAVPLAPVELWSELPDPVTGWA